MKPAWQIRMENEIQDKKNRIINNYIRLGLLVIAAVVYNVLMAIRDAGGFAL